VSEQATKADTIVDEALVAGLDGSHSVTLQAKMLGQELLQVKADLERELERLVLDCFACGPDRALGRWARSYAWALGASRVAT
jgi:hypothetical protein